MRTSLCYPSRFPLPRSLWAWLLALALPTSLPAQGVLNQFSYEGLRLSGIGVEMGAVASNRLTTEPTPALRVDCGVLAPRVRLLLGGSYFKGQFKPDEIARFAQRLRAVVVDPTNDFTINVGTITWSELEADLDLQYLFPNGPVRTYVGLGLGVHLRNGDGAAINGTFVEDALDTIAAGLHGSMGAEVRVAPPLALTADLRGVLTSELRAVTLRGGLMLRFRQKGVP